MFRLLKSSYENPEDSKIFQLIKAKYDGKESTLEGDTVPKTQLVETELENVQSVEPSDQQPPATEVVTEQPQTDKINYTAAVLSAVLYCVSVSLIVYGAIHLNDCPAQNMISIVLTVMGALHLITRFLNIPDDYRSIFKGQEYYRQSRLMLWLNIIFQVAVICAFLTVCYGVFSINPSTKPEEHGLSNYCELQFYRNVKWGCILGLTVLGIGLILFCCAVFLIIRRIQK